MAVILMKWRIIFTLIVSFFLLFFYNEFLIYYIVLIQCPWPQLSTVDDYQQPLKIVVLSDIHLLGSREGHWFDKLRREWQMERSFQASMFIHSPDVVFVLGDLFDEGKWCSDSEFHYYTERFTKMFSVPANMQMFVVVGNHDIGFHYMVSEHKHQRFTKAFSSPSVRSVRVGDDGNNFVLLNSIAFEEDGCAMCREAESLLSGLISDLDCVQGKKRNCKLNSNIKRYSRPIILQHYPLYRPSDSKCDGPGSAPQNEKSIPFKQKFDVLDKSVSRRLLKDLNPRLVISGHIHHFCLTNHTSPIDGETIIPEWTVPSFSWRNKNDPSFLMITLNNNEESVFVCEMPRESTVINTYLLGTLLILVWFIFLRGKFFTYLVGFRNVDSNVLACKQARN